MNRRMHPMGRPILASGNLSKVAPFTTNPNKAEAPQPQPTTGAGENRIQISTYFTKAPVVGEDTPIIYNGDRMWSSVTLTLETAGPCAVGNLSALAPVLSGRGQLLATGVPMTFDVPKGQRLYVVATGVNRIKVTVEAFPWLETIAGKIDQLIAK